MDTQEASGLSPAQEDMRRRLDAQERAELVRLRQQVGLAARVISRMSSAAREAEEYLRSWNPQGIGTEFSHRNAVVSRLSWVRDERANYERAMRELATPSLDANGAEVSP